jgi:hypothetical protein
MGRPRKSDDSFSFSDLAVAGAMTKRAVQHVADAGLLPPGGDIRALKRIATIGAFMSVGVPLFLASKLANIILYEFNQSDGEAPCGLNFMARHLPDTELKKLPPTESDYWYHAALFRCSDIYPRGKCGVSDALVEIVDRRHLFMTQASKLPVLNLATGNVEEASFIGWVEGWGRGSDDARVVYVTEQIGRMDDEENPRWRETATRVCAEAEAARSDAVGKLTVNVSLGIRNALDRLAEFRTSARGKSE